MMKYCNTCKKEKPKSEFHGLFRRGVVRLQFKCKECAKAYRKANSEKEKLRMSAWAKKNSKRMNQRTAEAFKRRMISRPKWLTRGDLIEMKWAYSLAREYTINTGVKHEVDHIIPLYNKIVCGLNVPWNMQILTSTKNREKGHKFGGPNV